MNIKQAIAKNADIICETIHEKNKCVDILHNYGAVLVHGISDGFCISVGSYAGDKGCYMFNQLASNDVVIKAPEFIASNTERHALYTPDEIEYMDKVAISAMQGDVSNTSAHDGLTGYPEATEAERFEKYSATYYRFAAAMLTQRRLLTSK